MKIFFVLISFIVIAKFSFAEKIYDFNLTCQQAYKEICQLKIKNAIALIEKAKEQNEHNLIPIYLESYIDIIELFFNEGIIEFKKRKDNSDERILKLKKGNENSPFYLFCLSNIYLHKSITQVRYGENMGAAWSARKAYLLIKENKDEFKTFTPNDLIFGTLQAITGTIPKSYNWIASILGMKGSLTNGMRVLKTFVNGNDPWAKFYKTESEFLFSYLSFYIENKKEETIKRIQNSEFDFENNHLLAYMATNLFVNGKQTDLAKQIILNRNKSSEYLATPVWDMQMGYARLHKLELAEAISSFEKYITNFKGNFYVKDVYQKISWAYYLQGNTFAAQKARDAVLQKGNTNSDADKQALKEAKNSQWPNIILLKSRLLNDGGYHIDALALLLNKTINSFEKVEEQLEFVYRLGRINDDLHKEIEAIEYYKQAIALGEFRKEYYAARAALQIGNIYENQLNKTEAIKYYSHCLAMGDHDYKSSLDQRAKSGIARCKGE